MSGQCRDCKRGPCNRSKTPMKSQHRCYKLSPQKIKSVQKHYEDLGWKANWLARYFGVHHSTIQYQIKSKGWSKRVKTPDMIPEEVAKIYRENRKIKYVDSFYRDTKQSKKKMKKGSYEYIRNLAEQQRLKSCLHVRWIKRCSICGKILESDAINHQL